jgi:hypothetical protein
VVEKVRIGDFDQTAPLELTTHWNKILENNETELELIMSFSRETAEEVADSQIAMQRIYDLS